MTEEQIKSIEGNLIDIGIKIPYEDPYYIEFKIENGKLYHMGDDEAICALSDISLDYKCANIKRWFKDFSQEIIKHTYDDYYEWDEWCDEGRLIHSYMATLDEEGCVGDWICHTSFKIADFM